MVLESLEYFINEHGYSPTYKELASMLNCDYNTVFKKILILMDKGYVSGVNGKARTLRVVKKYD
jgi:DNA-binding CsgD family transcriptional regulator